MSKGKLALREKLGYGVCDLGGNLFFTAMGLWLMAYLTDTVGIEAGLAGIVVGIGKIWDAFTDPLAGFLSDRTKSRWGRRRPWMLFGSFPLLVTMIIMFTNPGLEGQWILFAWGVIAFCLLNTAYTAVNIPYNSLTPELTSDYHERSVLNGYRFGFAVVGTLLGAGTALIIVNSFASKDTGFSAMGTIFGAVMLVTALITFFSVREPERGHELTSKGFLKTYLKVFRNKPYVIILLVYTLHVTALTIVMSAAFYYFRYIHMDENATSIAMVILLVTAFIFIPLSVVVAKKMGKKIVYAIGMLVFAIMMIVIFMEGHVHDVKFSFILMIFTGIGLGFTYAMPWAIIPDTVEYDYLKTGERTEGAFYGIWTFGIKIGQAIAMGITGLVLSKAGYIANVTQTLYGRIGIRLLVGPISAAVFLLSIMVLVFYPITEKRYKEILRGIEEMEAKGS